MCDHNPNHFPCPFVPLAFPKNIDNCQVTKIVKVISPPPPPPRPSIWSFAEILLSLLPAFCPLLLFLLWFICRSVRADTKYTGRKRKPHFWLPANWTEVILRSFLELGYFVVGWNRRKQIDNLNRSCWRLPGWPQSLLCSSPFKKNFSERIWDPNNSLFLFCLILRASFGFWWFQIKLCRFYYSNSQLNEVWETDSASLLVGLSCCKGDPQ